MAAEKTVDVKSLKDDSPIIFYTFEYLGDSSRFRTLLEERFRNTGHTRRIEFRHWDCYHEVPETDGDIYVYDACTMSALVDKGIIRILPEIIDTGNVFDWILDRSRIRGKIYGFPFMTCTNVLICRKKDYTPVNNIFEIEGGLSAPLKSMLGYYSVLAFCNYQDRGEGSIKAITKIFNAMGGREAFEESKLDAEKVIDKFRSGKCRYLLGFTETLRFLDRDEYVVQLANLSENAVNEMPLFMTDFISMGHSTSGEKLLDCLDIMEIITDSSFVRDLCTGENGLEYMLPADKTLYPVFAELDPVYNQLYDLVSDENNGIFRYGSNFYEEFDLRKAYLLELIRSMEDA
jgi:hypothetical protein